MKIPNSFYKTRADHISDLITWVLCVGGVMVMSCLPGLAKIEPHSNGGELRAILSYKNKYLKAVEWCKKEVQFVGYWESEQVAKAVCADTYMRYNYKPEVAR